MSIDLMTHDTRARRHIIEALSVRGAEDMDEDDVGQLWRSHPDVSVAPLLCCDY